MSIIDKEKYTYTYVLNYNRYTRIRDVLSIALHKKYHHQFNSEDRGTSYTNTIYLYHRVTVNHTCVNLFVTTYEIRYAIYIYITFDTIFSAYCIHSFQNILPALLLLRQLPKKRVKFFLESTHQLINYTRISSTYTCDTLRRYKII